MSVVLVTGAGGFVGSAIVHALVRREARFRDGDPAEVVALVQPGGSSERLAGLPDDGTWRVVRADVSERHSLEAALEGIRPRAVIHAALDRAAYEHVDEKLVREPLEILLRSMRDVPRSRFLHVGSAWVLAPGQRLDEAARLDPVTQYARNKALQDTFLPALADAAGVPWINLRLFNLFGRYEREHRLIPTLVARLSRGEGVDLTHGDQIRDFNDVDVAAAAFADALAAPDDACGAVYHVGSGRGTAVRELAGLIAGILGGESLLRFGASGAEDEGISELVADPSRASATLGWRPDLDLEGRVREAVAWWQERLAARHPSEVGA